MENTKMRKQIKKEIEPTLLTIGGIIAFTPVIVSGMIHNLVKAFYNSFQYKFWRGIVNFVLYWLNFIYQVWNVVKYIQLHLIIAYDLLANVAGGEMIEDIVTAEEKTLYGRGDITISAATGKVELDNKLNKTGKKFTHLLSKVLGQGHSVEAYLSEIKKNN